MSLAAIPPSLLFSNGVWLPPVSIGQKDQHDHDDCDCERRSDAAQVEAALLVRLRQGIAERGSQGARQNVRGPEENAVRNLREVMKRRNDHDETCEDQRAALES